jgi:ubiquinone/menaquinone biosynthesis C-methylase UbiE
MRRAAIWSRVFALAYDPFLWLAERSGMRKLRRELLSRARGRVLEIGSGTGLNVEHFGDGVTELVLSEPELLLHPRLKRRLAASGKRAKIIAASAEVLPFGEDAFDTVVVTLVLCTVPAPGSALSEIARVLKPQGQLLFIEHVRAPEGSHLLRWQDRLHGFWRAFACGCQTNRDTLRLLTESPLAISDVSTSRWRLMPAIVQPLIIGSALRPS